MTQNPSDKPEQISLAKIVAQEENSGLPPRYNIAVTPTEHKDDREARLAEAKHSRWRESLRFIFIDIIVKMAVFGAIISGLAWSATILADKNSTAEAKNVADSSIKLILGSITGFAVGKGSKSGSQS